MRDVRLHDLASATERASSRALGARLEGFPIFNFGAAIVAVREWKNVEGSEHSTCAPAAPAARWAALVLLLLFIAAEGQGHLGLGAATPELVRVLSRHFAAAAGAAGLVAAAAGGAAGGVRRGDGEFNASFAGGGIASINFMAVALDDTETKGYERFLPSYVAFALTAQPRGVAEVIVASAADFEHRNREALRLLRRAFPGRLLVREPVAESVMLAARMTPRGWRMTARWFETPHLRAAVTYIGDIDCLIVLPPGGCGGAGQHPGEGYGSFFRGDAAPVDNMAEEHLAHMRAFDPPLPYSNVLRVPFPRDGVTWRQLTGFQAMDTERYYEAPSWRETLQYFAQLPEEDLRIDNVALQRVAARAFGLPERGALAPAVAADEAAAQRALLYSPRWGIHISPNRGGGLNGMNNKATCGQCRAVAAVAALPWYAEFVRVSAEAADVQRALDALCACCAPEDGNEKLCSVRR